MYKCAGGSNLGAAAALRTLEHGIEDGHRGAIAPTGAKAAT
jgi:hypothetical protein